MNKTMLFFMACALFGANIVTSAADTISVAKALEIGKQLKADEKTSVEYVIAGYVSALGEDYNTTYRNQTYWIADTQGMLTLNNDMGAFMVYRGKADKEVKIGYKVFVTSPICYYHGSIVESMTSKPVNIVEEREFSEFSGYCGAEGDGSNLSWRLNTQTGILDITGTGVMADSIDRQLWRAAPACIRIVRLPEGLTHIGSKAFMDCSALPSITIPKSITSIGFAAFKNCDGLKEVHISDLTAWCNITTPTSNFNANPLYYAQHLYLGDTEIKDLVIPEGIKEIKSCAFRNGKGFTSITISNTVRLIGSGAFRDCSNVKSIVFPNSVDSVWTSSFIGCTAVTDPVYNDKIFVIMPKAFVGTYRIPKGIERIASVAFENCTELTSVYLPNSIKKVGIQAFYNCSALETITCEAATPPTCKDTLNETFKGVKKTIPLYVPAGSENAYKTSSEWQDFTNIQSIGQASQTEVTQPQAEPMANGVVISWPAVSGAQEYSIVIMKGKTVVCTLRFDAKGQLLTAVFSAPVHKNGASQPAKAMQTATGWQYTIGGLEANTAYTFTVTTKIMDETEDVQSGSFTTLDNAEGLDEILESSNPEILKFVRNGQLFILRDGVIYNAQGARVE